MSLRGLALGTVLLAGAAAAQAQEPIATLRGRPATPPPGMQWLYGSGEGAAASIQAYRAFQTYVIGKVRARPRESVVLAPGATLAAPRFIPCGRRPLAVVLDVDETALQNLGHGYDEAVRGRVYNQEIWNRYEETGQRAVLPMPGAASTLAAVRRAGVTVIFNTNRLSRFAAQTRQAIEGAGLGPARHRETLWLKGDIGTGSQKDPRRAAISRRYCVIAMAGDQLGDFSDLFNAEGLGVRPRRAAAGGAYAHLWGNGWFMLSNPVYGPSIEGDFDDVFPADRRWSDPQGGND
ncbi:MAG TPA: HAD family acid phosphatase [Allosphingosinicella sp.]|nr:HAD family acid phosphatase [Allosphingosinicella sp.]